VISDPRDPEHFCRVERRGGRRSHLVLVGLISGVLAIAAETSPAFASDGVDPVPAPALVLDAEEPPAADLELGTLEEQVLEPELEEPPIVIDTSAVGNEIDVSVRVLSPDPDAVETSADTVADVISPAPEPDIAPDPAPVTAPSEPASLETSGLLNTNVSVRVLSPGRSAPVSQMAAAAAATHETLDDEGPTPGVADELLLPDDPAPVTEDSPQYHEEISQYQSEEIPQVDPWRWEWYLTLDCNGVTNSTWAEFGDPSSPSWEWIWDWNWDCGLDGASEASGDALERGLSSLASLSQPSSGTSGTSTPGADPDEGSADPWQWTWTFDFCGHENTFSIGAGAQTALLWAWDWNWVWACTVQPAIGGEGQSGTAADLGGGSVNSELPPTPLAVVTVVPLFFAEVSTAIVPHLLVPFSGVELSVPAVIPLSSAPSRIGSGPVALPPAGPGRPSVSAAAPTHRTLGLGASGSTVSSDGDERARPQKTRDRDATAPRPTRLPRLPLGPARRAAGSSSSGGTAPSGTGAGGFAALTALFVFAAPGLGRRLRDVRELSPRTRYEAPRDRPG
jgi:hypothetical protein